VDCSGWKTREDGSSRKEGNGRSTEGTVPSKMGSRPQDFLERDTRYLDVPGS